MLLSGSSKAARDAPNYHILGLVGEVRAVEIGEVVILDPMIRRAPG
jgi:hypothetical protein